MTTTAITPAQEWIDEICRQFRDATGWRLKYVPLPAKSDVGTAALAAGMPEACWASVISDGTRNTGILTLDAPEWETSGFDLPAASKLADIVSGLISRAESAHRSLDARSHEVSTLVDMGRSVSSEADTFAALECLLKGAVELTGFRTAAFFLLNPATGQLALRGAFGLERCHIPAGIRDLRIDPPDLEALARGVLLIHRDEHPDMADWLPPSSASGLCVAVQSEGGPIGTLWAYDRRQRTATDREVHVLQSIAAQVAAALERLVLLRESADQHRLQKDLQVASEFQSGDLPARLKSSRGFSAAAVCSSRYELGGDLCELVPLDDDRTVVVVGDASGDSIPAAMLMSAVRGALRSLVEDRVEEVLKTSRVVERINRTLHGISAAHQFMSLIYGILDTRGGTLTYTNAGHPVPIHVRDGRPIPLESHGMLLGVLADSAYERGVVKLGPGDLLIMYTDGVSEAMNGRRMMFRSEGIFDAIRNRLTASAQEILETVLAKLETHTDGGGDSDDRTLLVIKMAEAGASRAAAGRSSSTSGG